MAKILVSMSDDFLGMVDNIAAIEQRTRSELIREALRKYIRTNRITDMELNNKRAEILESLLD